MPSARSGRRTPFTAADRIGLQVDLAQVAVDPELDPLQRALAGLAEEEPQPLREVHGRPHLVVEVAGEREEVHRLLDDAALQVVAHLDARCRCPRAPGPPPSPRRGAASPRTLRVLRQPPVLRRLLRVDVEGGPRHPAAVEGGEQRLARRSARRAPRSRCARPALILAKRVLAEQVLRLLGERRVQGDEVAAWRAARRGSAA